MTTQGEMYERHSSVAQPIEMARMELLDAELESKDEEEPINFIFLFPTEFHGQ